VVLGGPHEYFCRPGSGKSLKGHFNGTIIWPERGFIYLRARNIYNFLKSNLYVGLDSDYAAAESLLEGCGRVFNAVKIYNIRKNYGSALDTFGQLFSRFTAPEIEVHFARVSDMGTMDAFVQNLYLSGATKIVSFNISALNVLPITTENLLRDAFNSSLKSFIFEGWNLDRLGGFWEAVGDTLEEIDMKTYDDKGWYRCINHLKNHCRKLTSVKLDNPLDDPQVSESDVADLLVSYGPQLLSADFYAFTSQKESARVARNCINVRCNVRIVGNDNNPLPLEVNSLPGLHNRVETIVFELDLDDISDWTPLHTAMKSCASLRKMIVFHRYSLRPVSYGAVEAVLPMKMHFLDRIMLSFPLESKSLDHIAAVTSKLKFVHLTCISPVNIESIGAICHSNPGLEVLKICEKGEDDVGAMDGLDGSGDEKQETLQFLTELIPRVIPCTSLRRLLLAFPTRKCPSMKNLRNVVASFRCRHTVLSLSFGDINFFHPVGGKSKLRREITKKNGN